ncbi:hypothetical protein D3C73_1651540 [compost metagenome]
MDRLCDAAWAVRTLARTEISIPAKPAAPERTAPIRKPSAAHGPIRKKAATKITTPTMPIVVY